MTSNVLPPSTIENIFNQISEIYEDNPTILPEEIETKLIQFVQTDVFQASTEDLLTTIFGILEYEASAEDEDELSAENTQYNSFILYILQNTELLEFFHDNATKEQLETLINARSNIATAYYENHDSLLVLAKLANKAKELGINIQRFVEVLCEHVSNLIGCFILDKKSENVDRLIAALKYANEDLTSTEQQLHQTALTALQKGFDFVQSKHATLQQSDGNSFSWVAANDLALHSSWNTWLFNKTPETLKELMFDFFSVSEQINPTERAEIEQLMQDALIQFIEQPELTEINIAHIKNMLDFLYSNSGIFRAHQIYETAVNKLYTTYADNPGLLKEFGLRSWDVRAVSNYARNIVTSFSGKVASNIESLRKKAHGEQVIDGSDKIKRMKYTLEQQ